MNDNNIVSRLRGYDFLRDGDYPETIMEEAADEIKRLEGVVAARQQQVSGLSMECAEQSADIAEKEEIIERVNRDLQQYRSLSMDTVSLLRQIREKNDEIERLHAQALEMHKVIRRLNQSDAFSSEYRKQPSRTPNLLACNYPYGDYCDFCGKNHFA